MLCLAPYRISAQFCCHSWVIVLQVLDWSSWYCSLWLRMDVSLHRMRFRLPNDEELEGSFDCMMWLPWSKSSALGKLYCSANYLCFATKVGWISFFAFWQLVWRQYKNFWCTLKKNDFIAHYCVSLMWQMTVCFVQTHACRRRIDDFRKPSWSLSSLSFKFIVNTTSRQE